MDALEYLKKKPHPKHADAAGLAHGHAIAAAGRGASDSERDALPNLEHNLLLGAEGNASRRNPLAGQCHHPQHLQVSMLLEHPLRLLEIILLGVGHVATTLLRPKPP